MLYSGLWSKRQYDYDDNRSNNNNNNNSYDYGSITTTSTSVPTAQYYDDFSHDCESQSPQHPLLLQQIRTPQQHQHEQNESQEQPQKLLAKENTSRAETATTDDENSDQKSISSISTEQELPSLTAAFKSIENRPMLRLCAWYLFIYFMIAIIGFSFVFERWSIIDSMYFAVATFTTCGYGELEPTTTGGQLFTIFFAIYGVIILGVFIAIFGHFITESQAKAFRKIHSRKQDQILSRLFPDDDNHKSKRFMHREKSGFVSDHISLADDAWSVIQAEFPALLLVAVCALFLGIREHWSITSTLYFCIMAATTTGYGDYAPSNPIDKLFCIIFYPLAVAVFGEVLGRIATIYIQRKQRAAERKFLHRALTLCDIRNMDKDLDGKVNREEFITFMLIALQKVDRESIEELREIFDQLDHNSNGYLEEADLVEFAETSYLPTLEQLKHEEEEQFCQVQRANSEMPSIVSNLFATMSPTAQECGPLQEKVPVARQHRRRMTFS